MCDFFVIEHPRRSPVGNTVPLAALYTAGQMGFWQAACSLTYSGVAQFLVVTDNSTSVPDQLRRMMAWEPIGGLAVFWR